MSPPAGHAASMGGATPIGAVARNENTMANVTVKSSTKPRRARAQGTDRHVGARMRERRIMLGLTQYQMAELIGVTFSRRTVREGDQSRRRGAPVPHRSGARCRRRLLLRGIGQRQRVQGDVAAAAAAGAGAQLHRHPDAQAPRSHLLTCAPLTRCRALNHACSSRQSAAPSDIRGWSASRSWNFTNRLWPLQADLAVR